MIRGIQEALQTNQYKCYLTGSGKSNYRFEIYPEYKANRKEEKPTHYHALRNYLLEVHGAELVYDQEADDALGIAQTNYNWNALDTHACSINRIFTESCIVSLDKDLRQIPGKHYNFVTKEVTEVTPEQGIRHFYHQLLMGDRIDNIPGIHGIGPKTAEKILKNCKTEKEMYERTLKEYGGRTDEVIRNGRLLHIRQREGELWAPPN